MRCLRAQGAIIRILTIRARLTFGVTAAAMTLASMPLTATPARAAGSVLPFASLFDIVVDDAHGHVFISGGASTATLPVYDLDGGEVTTLAAADPSGMVLDGDTLYVAEAGGPSIAVVDAAASPPAIVDRFSIDPFVNPRDLTMVAGRLWLFADSAAADDVLVAIDPDGSNLSDGFEAGANYDPRFVEGVVVGSTLAMFDRGLSPATLYLYDGATVPPTFLRQKSNISESENMRQAAMLPDGASIVTASGWPYVFPQVRTSDLLTVRTYGANAYPTAVAVSADGTTIVGGSDSPYDPDVWVYVPGTSDDMWHQDFDGSSLRLLPGGVAITGDGNTVFAVHGNVSGNPSLEVLHPGVEPPGDPSQATVTIDIEPRRIRYGEPVELWIHLDGGAPNAVVNVYGHMTTGAGGGLGTWSVNDRCNLRLTYEPAEAIEYSVRYMGDTAWLPDQDVAPTVRVHARIKGRMVRQFANRDGYALYRPGSTPRMRVRVDPNHVGDPVTYTLQGRIGGSWIQLDEDRYLLNEASLGAARVINTRAGVDYRVKITFEGDDRNLADATMWLYFRKVSSRVADPIALRPSARSASFTLA